MNDWGLASLSFAAITGGLAWVVYFGWDLYTNAPPGTHSKDKKEHKHDRRRAA
jgi:hypothetical protein